MLGIYFSGTGNSKYCIEKFLQLHDGKSKAFSIEDDELIKHISEHSDIVFSYPVQYSNVPKILNDFILDNKTLWKDKRVFIIATMGLFSGDGAGVLGRLLIRYGAGVIGGLHLKMPDSICDEKVLKRSLEKNQKLIFRAEKKIEKSVGCLKSGKPTRDGLSVLSRIIGLFGQRLYFGGMTKHYSDKLKINTETCICCKKCISLCPMKNIKMEDNLLTASNKCTLCYRCVNNCPAKAISLLGRQVIQQSVIEGYLK